MHPVQRPRKPSDLLEVKPDVFKARIASNNGNPITISSPPSQSISVALPFAWRPSLIPSRPPVPDSVSQTLFASSSRSAPSFSGASSTSNWPLISGPHQEGLEDVAVNSSSSSEVVTKYTRSTPQLREVLIA